MHVGEPVVAALEAVGELRVVEAEQVQDGGVEVMDMGQAQFAAYVKADYEKWRKVAREANIVVE